MTQKIALCICPKYLQALFAHLKLANKILLSQIKATQEVG